VTRPLGVLLLLGLASGSTLLTASCAGSAAPRLPLTPAEERILRPLIEPPDRVRRLVEDGDEWFLKGIPPFRGAEPDVSLAMDCYTKARKSYLTAQGFYVSPQPVPPPLLDRVNETVARIAVLIKRQRALR
jgi:hypothetical protein